MADAVSGGTPVEVAWINHASFLYCHAGVRLICDPWLSGSAFNNGWRHITPTQFAPEDFADVTHVWLSHQHPDHFAPQDLRRIAMADRARITVLYQTVADKLVVSWLRSNGFGSVREIEMERWFELAPGVEALCAALGEDSWLAVRGGGLTLLNVNDCVLKYRADVERIKELAGPVDVLFTQFSYAQWIGNPRDVERRRADAREKFERIRLQCRVLDPKVVVPFASYVYFSNSENFFMNDSMNRVSEICEFIESDLGKNAAVLYPGERWRVPQAVDWRSAAQRYERDAQSSIAAGPKDAPRLTDPSQFLQQINDFLSRLRAKSPFAAMLLRDRATLYLTDHCTGYELSIHGLRPLSSLSAETADIATASENVLYAFRTPWGGNTLHVSGRFASYRAGGHMRFFRFMSKLHYYNRTPINMRWCKKQSGRLTRAAIRRGSRAAQKIVSRLAPGRATASPSP